MITINEVDIILRYGHYEAFIDGHFICSGDTRKECEDEAKDYLETLDK